MKLTAVTLLLAAAAAAAAAVAVPDTSSNVARDDLPVARSAGDVALDARASIRSTYDDLQLQLQRELAERDRLIRKGDRAGAQRSARKIADLKAMIRALEKLDGDLGRD